MAGVRQWEAWLDGCEDGSTPPQGFILTLPQPEAAKKQQQQQGAEPPEGQQGADAAPAAVYQEFEPLQLAQHADRPALRFPTFDAAVAEFFGKASRRAAPPCSAHVPGSAGVASNCRAACLLVWL